MSYEDMTYQNALTLALPAELLPDLQHALTDELPAGDATLSAIQVYQQSLRADGQPCSLYAAAKEMTDSKHVRCAQAAVCFLSPLDRL